MSGDISSPGLLRCALCGQKVRHNGGKLAVHYATASDTKPCPNSWPQPKNTNGVRK